MQRSAPVDGFSLAYERHGSGAPVVLLHGWPGDHGDWREVVARLDGQGDVVLPDLRGFGESDKHVRDPAQAYSAAGQAASVVGLLGELGLGPAVFAGYDVASRLLARTPSSSARSSLLRPYRAPATGCCQPMRNASSGTSTSTG
jgi:pimeloyl-ACP methyl ester carboxylesterase